MKSPLQRIEELIVYLPQKDYSLAQKFLKNRNFEGILDLVNSDLYKIHKNKSINELPDEYENKLTDLLGELTTYMSYLEVPDNSDDYDYY